MFYKAADRTRVEKVIIPKDEIEPTLVDAKKEKLDDMENFCDHEDCRRQFLLAVSTSNNAICNDAEALWRGV